MNREQRPAHNLTFTYDEIGNIVTEHKAGSSSTTYFNWGKGRQLGSLSYGTSAESATTVVAHEYNSDGIRISRTFKEGGLEYIVDGDRILKQVGCGLGVLQTLEFYYDAQGEMIGFNYNGNDYYYGKNVQGDVVELYDRWSLIATYEYDAWGVLLSIKDANGNIIPDDINSKNVASINPIRYRGSPWPNSPFDGDIAMLRNKRWINDMMKEGREIIDIGPDFARRRLGKAPSDFYNMERTQVKGYAKYDKVFTRNGKYGGLIGEW